MQLLIDADVVVYQSAAVNQETWTWEEDVSTTIADHALARYTVDEQIKKYCQKLGTDQYLIILSDPDRSAIFRKEILPTYKEDRKAKEKPVLLQHLVEYIQEKHPSLWVPRLEGDDLMGVLQQDGTAIVSIDKDMKTVPGKLYNPMDEESGVVEITAEEADWFHLQQTLMGDTVDNYKGCPGIGPIKAANALNEADYTSPYKYRDDPDAWREWMWNTAVIPLYEKKKLTEADALVQARCAHILRRGDYNFKTQEIATWTPYPTHTSEPEAGQ